MTITINGEAYNKAFVHQLFKSGRKAISSHVITDDDHDCINKALLYTEMFTHILGNLPEITDFVKDQ